MGQAVFEGEEFAQQHNHLSEDDFRKLGKEVLGGHSVQYEAAIADYLEYTKQGLGFDSTRKS